MKVKVEKAGPCRKTLVVELPADVVEAEYVKVLDDFSQVAGIPGFRKGRAPRSLVESHFSKQMWDEIKDRLISRSYPEALKQAKLNPLMILDLKSEAALKKTMNYRVTLDVPPEFKLPRYKNIAVTHKPVEVSGDDVQKALDRLLERLARTEPVSDRPVRKGDFAQIDYTRKDTDGGQPRPDSKQRNVFMGGRDFWLALDDQDTFLPGFAALMAGMTIGSRKDIVLQIPPDFKVPELAGKQVVYDVLLKAVHERKMPVLNAEFFQSVGVESETALREKMRTTLLEEGERQEKERRKNEIIEYLLQRTDIELPESLVQEEARHMFASLARERLMRGSTREQIESQREELLTTATKTAGEKVKLGYILHKIGEEEKIGVEAAEIEKEIQNMAQRYRMMPDELRKELEEKKEIDTVRHEIRMGKILDFLLANSAVEEKGFISRLFKGGSKEPESTV